MFHLRDAYFVRLGFFVRMLLLFKGFTILVIYTQR